MESSQPVGDTGGTPQPSGTPEAPPASSPPSSSSKVGPITGSDFRKASSAARSEQPGASGQAAPQEPPSSGTPPVVPATPDPIPYDRFQEVNGKYEKVKWAETYEDPAEVQTAVNLARWLDRDPQGAFDYVSQQLRRAGLIADQQPQTPPAPQPQDEGFPEPDVPVQGTDIKLYSAEQNRRAVEYAVSKALAQVEEQLKPLQTEAQQRQQRELQARVWQQASSEANQMVTEARSWEGFSEHEREIEAVMIADRRLSLHTAYQRVVGPKLEARHRQKFADEMRQQSNGSTRNPGSPPPPSTKELRKLPISTLFAREMARRGLTR